MEEQGRDINSLNVSTHHQHTILIQVYQFRMRISPHISDISDYILMPCFFEIQLSAACHREIRTKQQPFHQCCFFVQCCFGKLGFMILTFGKGNTRKVTEDTRTK